MTTTLEGLKFSKAGVLIEFPDLKNNKEWKEIAINRLKEHIKSIPIEEHKLNYVKAELIKHGYVPMFKQRAGFRPKNLRMKNEWRMGLDNILNNNRSININNMGKNKQTNNTRINRWNKRSIFRWCRRYNGGNGYLWVMKWVSKKHKK